MDTKIIVAVLIIIFLAHVVQTITGFAGSMLAIPFLTFFINMNDAKVLITLIGLAWSIGILYTDHQFINKKFLIYAISLMTVGMIIGTVLVNIIPANVLMVLMGITIILAAFHNLVIHQSRLKPNRIRDVCFGILAGIMQGMVLMGGPLLVVLTNAHFTDRRYYRATLAALWLVVDIILIALFGINQTIYKSALWLSALGMTPLILSIYIGNILNRKLSHQKFNILVNGLLIFSGITILIQGLT